MRPSDWFLVGLPGDPAAGDAFGVRGLAATYGAIAAIAGDASDGVTRARSSGAASAWVGDAGHVFREKSHRMPGELAAAGDSYAVVAAALRVWADTVDDTQAQADRGLQQAREAHADRASALAVLVSAQSSWSTVHAQQLTYQRLEKDYASVPPPPGLALPTPDQLRSAARSASQSRAAIAAAQSRIADADARLAAARALVLDAKTRRDDAEAVVVHRVAEAEDRAVKPSSVWEAIQDSAAWQTLVAIATVVLTIVSIVAIVIGGPLVWAIILAATLLLIVNALLSIAQGKDAWGELALLAVGLIPGGRLLGMAVRGVVGSGAGGGGGDASRRTDVPDDIERVGADRLSRSSARGRQGRMVVDRSAPGGALERVAVLATLRHLPQDRPDHARALHVRRHRPKHAHQWMGGESGSMRSTWETTGSRPVDNTRLLAAREADIPVRVTMHDPKELLKPDGIKRFRTVGQARPNTWGDAVYGRIADQWDGWGLDHPHGSLDLPKITGRPQ